MRQTLGNVGVLLRDARGTAVFAICFPSLTSYTHFFSECFTIWFVSPVLDGTGGLWEELKQCCGFHTRIFPQKSGIQRREAELGLIHTPDNKQATASLPRLRRIKRTDLLFQFAHHVGSVALSELHWLLIYLIITRFRWHLFRSRVRQWLFTSIWLWFEART